MLVKAGELFDRRYRVLAELGSGGMSYVYSARDEELQETVALKIVRPELAEDEEFVARFKREVRIARQIRHPNVIHVFEFGHAELAEKTLPYLTMELLQGQDLARWMRPRRPVGLADVLRIALQLCDGLAEAHRLGVVHRDIKPQNIFIDDKGRVKLMDFGISRLATLPAVTQGGKLVGTPKYMSPEQVHRRVEPDQRSDLYSVGVVLYELATGKPPFEGENSVEIAIRHMEQTPRRPRDIHPRVPEALESVILTCLEKEPARRFSSASALRSTLESIPVSPGAGAQETTVATAAGGKVPPSPSIAMPTTGALPPTRAVPRGREESTLRRPGPRRRSPRGWAAVFVSVALAGVAAAWFLGGGARTPPPREPESTGPAPQESTQPAAETPVSAATATPTPTASASVTAAAEEPEPTREASGPAAAPRRREASAPPAAEPPPPRPIPNEPRTAPPPAGRAPAEGSARSMAPTPSPPAKAPRFGTVRITANPGTEIHVDGQLWGTIPPIIQREIAAGPHRVRYVIPGYAEHEETVEVGADRLNELSHHFPPYGGLRVNARPYARVEFDGRDLGFTPVTLKVRAGEHRLVLRREGFAPIEQSIRIEPGRINTFQFRMRRQR